VSLKADDNALAHRHGDQWLDAWIFAGGRRTVDCVWRAGIKLVTGGRHIHREAIGRRYRQALHKVLQSS
jgi:cytosine/adenosine deaminase-related metal-dependent hydrolase